MTDDPDHSSRPVVRLAVGAVLVVLLVLLTTGVATDSGWLNSLDRRVADDLNAWVAPDAWLVTFWKVITEVGQPLVFRIFALVAGVLLWWRHRRRAALTVLITVAGAAALSAIVKASVDRPRPQVPHPVAALPDNASYPSGHALTSSAALSVLVVLLWPQLRIVGRTALSVAVPVVVALIGISRLCLGVHYLSDVVGGWLFGGLWLLITTSLIGDRALNLPTRRHRLGFRA